MRGEQLLFPRRVNGPERKELVDKPGKSWKQWAREDLARYWYVILCLFADLSLNLQFVENFTRYGDRQDLILSIVSAVALIPIVYVEHLIYKRLFPHRG